jgi:hypothetical protein
MVAKKRVKTHVEKHVEQPRISRTNNYLIAIFAIVAIVIIVILALKSGAQSTITSALPNVGQATAVLQETRSCKILVSVNNNYDTNTLSVTLGEGASTYYAGNTITIEEVNSNGCILSVNSVSEFLAIGQLQKISITYVTVKDVII